MPDEKVSEDLDFIANKFKEVYDDVKALENSYQDLEIQMSALKNRMDYFGIDLTEMDDQLRVDIERAHALLDANLDNTLYFVKKNEKVLEQRLEAENDPQVTVNDLLDKLERFK